MLPEEKPRNLLTVFGLALPVSSIFISLRLPLSLSQRVRSKAPTAFTATSKLPQPGTRGG
uniref:Uncharacterized protein n=1 Tax=Arundo donax TaxID=35708 RepID=A0A0A9ERU4_ARUDO